MSHHESTLLFLKQFKGAQVKDMKASDNNLSCENPSV